MPVVASRSVDGRGVCLGAVDDGPGHIPEHCVDGEDCLQEFAMAPGLLVYIQPIQSLLSDANKHIARSRVRLASISGRR